MFFMRWMASNMSWEHNGGIQSGPYDQNYGVLFMGTNGTLVADRDKWRVFPEGDGEDWRMPEMEEVNKRSYVTSQSL